MSDNRCGAAIVCFILCAVFWLLLFLICGCEVIDTACDPDFAQPEDTAIVFGVKQIAILVAGLIVLIVYFNRRRLSHAK